MVGLSKAQIKQPNKHAMDNKSTPCSICERSAQTRCPNTECAKQTCLKCRKRLAGGVTCAHHSAPCPHCQFLFCKHCRAGATGAHLDRVADLRIAALQAQKKRKHDGAAGSEEQGREKRNRVDEQVPPPPPASGDDDTDYDEDIVPILNPLTALRALQRSLRSSVLQPLDQAVVVKLRNIERARERAVNLRVAASANPVAPPLLDGDAAADIKLPEQLQMLAATHQASLVPSLQQRFQDITKNMPFDPAVDLVAACTAYIEHLDRVAEDLQRLSNDIYTKISEDDEPMHLVSLAAPPAGENVV